MDMKQHILAALQEEFERWKELLAGLSQEQISTPLLPSNWTIQDNMAHLWAWQQRSIARVEAALLDREPDFPRWPADLDPEVEGNTDRINAWIYATYRQQPWSTVYQNWRAGFQRFLETADGISERDLLDGGRFPWLNGYPLALILVASYDHHQEHLEMLQTWLRKSEDTGSTG